jgi:hypothetical protein
MVWYAIPTDFFEVVWVRPSSNNNSYKQPTGRCETALPIMKKEKGIISLAEEHSVRDLDTDFIFEREGKKGRENKSLKPMPVL